MKKFISLILSIISAVCVSVSFCGCGGEAETETGTFYTVAEAYENGFITREDVMSIAYYHNGGTEFNETIMDENFTPQPLIPEEPTAETDKAIKTSFYKSEYWQRYENNYSYEDIRYGFFGKYNNALALKMSVYGEPVFLMAWKETVDDIIIDYTDTRQILILVIDL